MVPTRHQQARHTPPVLPIVHLVGARPNFMKAAPVIAALGEFGIQQRLVHSGQHYSDALSDVSASSGCRPRT
jgi:UDP-N-acetylglucosamine 2-epimerase